MSDKDPIVRGLGGAADYIDYRDKWNDVPLESFRQAAQGCYETHKNNKLKAKIYPKHIEVTCYSAYKKDKNRIVLNQNGIKHNQYRAIESNFSKKPIFQALLLPTANKILDRYKHNPNKKLNWEELRILIEVAESNHPKIQNFLKQNKLSKLIHTHPIAQDIKTLSDISKIIDRLNKYWPHETPKVLTSIYKAAIPHIQSPEQKTYDRGHKRLDPKQSSYIETSRMLVKESSHLIYDLAIKNNDDEAIQFLATNIIQHPNPEVEGVIDKIMNHYIPTLINNKKLTDFINKNLDLNLLEAAYYQYNEQSKSYPKILAFLCRYFPLRKDAQEALEELMLRELTEGKDVFLNFFLQETVETGNISAIHRIKEILAGKIPMLDTRARLITLNLVLKRDESFKIFNSFLNNQNKNNKDKNLKYDLNYVVTQEIIPPHLKFLDKSTPLKSSITAELYEKLYSNLLNRKLYEPLKQHLDTHYNSHMLYHHDYTEKLICDMAKHKELHPFLLDHINSGSPYLGFEILRSILDDQTDESFELKPGSFLEYIKDSSLDSIHNRYEAEAKLKFKSGPFVWVAMTPMNTLAKAINGNFSQANDIAFNGFNQPNLSLKFGYVLFFSENLFDQNQLSLEEPEDDEKLPKFSLERNQSIEQLKLRLKNLDLGFITEQTYALNQHEMITGHTPPNTEQSVIRLANQYNYIFDNVTFDLNNHTALNALNGFFKLLEQKALSCLEWTDREPPKLENKIYSLFKRFLTQQTYSTQNKDPQIISNAHKWLTLAIDYIENKSSIDNNINPRLMNKLASIVRVDQRSQETIEALIRIANQFNHSSLEALEQIEIIYTNAELEAKKGVALKINSAYMRQRMLRFLRSYDIVRLKDINCGEKPKEWESKWRQMASNLFGLRNIKAYRALREDIEQNIIDISNKIQSAETFNKDLNKHSMALINDLEHMFELAAKGAGDGQMAIYIARDLTNWYNNNENLFNNTLDHLAGILENNAAEQIFFKVGSINDKKLIFASYINVLKSHTIKHGMQGSYAQLAILAQTDIDGLSNQARSAMRSIGEPKLEKLKEIYFIYRRNSR
ncbi:hypothetical protein BVY03_03430 [bacterium K02(2017)]|nr:hypothetical protein BVY03_03430 [bacterium K02(2017)]